MSELINLCNSPLPPAPEIIRKLQGFNENRVFFHNCSRKKLYLRSLAGSWIRQWILLQSTCWNDYWWAPESIKIKGCIGRKKVGNGFLSVEYFRTKATLLMFGKVLNVPLIMTQLFFLTRVLLKTCFFLIITIKKEDLSYEFIYSLSFINIFIYTIIHFG